ncbi:MAG: MFS transporter [Myxococcota bacterium]|nr:MFS transporter [Myxococcota bacterium]
MRLHLGGVYFASFGVLGAVAPYLALDLQSRGLSGWALALSMGALPFGRLVAGPVWSLLADRYQAGGRILRFAAVVAMVGTLGIVTLPVTSALLAVLVMAMGRAPMGPVVDTMTLRSLGDQKLAYGRVRLWGSAGFLVFTLVAAALRDGVGASPLWVGVALSGLLVLQTSRLPAGDRLERVEVGPALRVLARDAPLRWILVASALHFAAHVGSTAFLAVHVDRLGLPTLWTGCALALGVGVEIVLMSQSSRVLRRVGPERLFVFSILLSIPRWLVMHHTDSAWILVAQQAFHGVTFGGFWLAGVAMVEKRAPERVSTSAQGLFSAAVGGVGALLGMVAGARIVDVHGTRALFLWMALAAAVAVLCAWRSAWLSRASVRG